jgi:hypothetical protein
MASTRKRRSFSDVMRLTHLAFLFILSVAASSCGLFGPRDETAEAAKLIQSANEDLREIKKLYEASEGDVDKPGKRDQLKQALEQNDAAAVRKIADEVNFLIVDGMNYAKTAIEKIQQAQEMNVNDKYREYLSLKEIALKKQVDAFEQYRQASRSLRDNYDPQNDAVRAKVKVEFDERTDKYRKLMEDARDFSSMANEVAKEAIREAQQ